MGARGLVGGAGPHLCHARGGLAGSAPSPLARRAGARAAPWQPARRAVTRRRCPGALARAPVPAPQSNNKGSRGRAVRSPHLPSALTAFGICDSADAGGCPAELAGSAGGRLVGQERRPACAVVAPVAGLADRRAGARIVGHIRAVKAHWDGETPAGSGLSDGPRAGGPEACAADSRATARCGAAGARGRAAAANRRGRQARRVATHRRRLCNTLHPTPRTPLNPEPLDPRPLLGP